MKSFQDFVREQSLTIKGLSYEDVEAVAPEITSAFDKVIPDIEKNAEILASSPTAIPDREAALNIYNAAWDIRDLMTPDVQKALSDAVSQVESETDAIAEEIAESIVEEIAEQSFRRDRRRDCRI